MMSTIPPSFIPVPGGIEIAIIFLIIILLFGASKIPEVAKSSGAAIGEFKKGKKQSEKELEEFEQRLSEELEESGDQEGEQPVSSSQSAGNSEPEPTAENE